jgi:hypothetical protein
MDDIDIKACQKGVKTHGVLLTMIDSLQPGDSKKFSEDWCKKLDPRGVDMFINHIEKHKKKYADYEVKGTKKTATISQKQHNLIGKETKKEKVYQKEVYVEIVLKRKLTQSFKNDKNTETQLSPRKKKNRIFGININ